MQVKCSALGWRLPYQKELALLRHVLRGEPHAVEESMESFGDDLAKAGGWAKFAGGSKAETLRRG